MPPRSQGSPTSATTSSSSSRRGRPPLGLPDPIAADRTLQKCPEQSIPTHLSIMCDLALILPPLAAAGYSMLYLLFGGGIGGAIVIFIVAKMLGK